MRGRRRNAGRPRVPTAARAAVSCSGSALSSAKGLSFIPVWCRPIIDCPDVGAATFVAVAVTNAGADPAERLESAAIAGRSGCCRASVLDPSGPMNYWNATPCGV